MSIGMIAKPYVSSYVPAAAQNAPWLAAFPGTNLDNNDYGRVAQSLASGGSVTVIYYVVIDLSYAQPVDTLALLWHTMPFNTTVTISYSSTNTASGWTTAATDLPARTGGTGRDRLDLWKFVATLPTPVSARYWRFAITMPTGTGTYQWSVSRAVVGLRAQFDIGAQKATLGAKDMNANVTTEVGETRSQEDPNMIRPVVALSFSYARQSEMERLMGGYTLSLGVSRPVLICTDLTSSYTQDNVAFGRLEKVLTHESDFYDVWSFEAVVTSFGV